MTGLEPLLGPPVAKAATTGLTKAGIWGGKKVLEARRKRKIRALLDSKVDSSKSDLLERLNESDIDNLVLFCESNEFSHCAISLSRARLIEGDSRKSERLASTVRSELAEGLRLFLGHSPQDGLADVLFAALNESVAICIKKLSDSDLLASPTLKAELVMTIGSLASAGVRNVDLMQSIDDIARINDFSVELRSQIAATSGTMRLPHAGTTRQVPYAQLFVQPRLFLREELEHAKKLKIMRPQDRMSRQAIDILDEKIRIVILGDPGGGKSTLSRHLTHQIAAETSTHPSRVPFFVELRDYAKSLRDATKKQTVVEYLEGICRSPYNITAPEDAVEYLLLNDRAVVVFDGLDELLDTSLRRAVVEIVEAFTHRFPTCPIVVTSRKIGYDEAPLDSALFSIVDLEEFKEEDVRTYVRNWFQLDDSIEQHVKRRLTGSFMEDSQFVSDLRVNPLMLSLMCGIYASENYIPTNRPDVYEKCSLLLFDRWDKQRGIEKALSFDAHVQAAMRSLALHMLTTSEDATLSRANTLEFMKSYLLKKRFDNEEDAENAAVEFIEFCKGRAWVLTDVGAETYGFTHRTFLEYFSASQLVKQNSSAAMLYDFLAPRIRAKEWDVVAQLSLQILGKQVEDGADDFLAIAIADCDSRKMNSEERNIVSFVVRSLEFLVPRPSILQGICDLAVEYSRDPKAFFSPSLRVGPNHEDWPILELQTVSSENLGRVGEATRSALRKSFSDAGVDERLLFACVVAFTYVAMRRSRSSIYWVNWAVENLSNTFNDVVEEKLSEYYWLALLKFERGELSLKDLLKMYGSTALYEYHIRGLEATRPPFAYRVLTTGEPMTDEHIFDEKTRAATRRRIRRQLKTELVTIMSSRVKMSASDMRPVTGALNLSSAASISNVISLVLSLPLIEAFANDYRKAFKNGDLTSEEILRRNGDIYGRLLLCRMGEMDLVNKIMDDLAAVIRQQPNVEDLIQDWLIGKLNLLQRPRNSRRQRASGVS